METIATPVKSGPKDVFTHLLAIIALYISAVSFGALFFEFINRRFPDPLIFYAAGSTGAIRWAIASLVIVFPVYVWLSWFIAKDVAADPAKRELKIRKWLIYFTLFAAAVVIIGDLIALIYNFLGGDLTARFLLKVLAVLFVAAAVFGYYLWNLRSERMASRDPRMRLFVFGVVAVVVIATVAGFFTVGSPFAERMRRFDEQRVQDLQNIQWQIINYWQRKDKIPSSLEDLRDPISGFTPAVDPETASVYGYRAVEKLKFELCADFKTSSIETNRLGPKAAYRVSAPGATPENWAHNIGRVCFERVIDPELYKLEKPAPR